MAAMVTASDIFGTQNKKECRIVTQQAACKFTGRLFKWQNKFMASNGLGCSLAFESERNVQLQASLSSVRQEFHQARKPVKRRRSSCLILKARPATARNDAMRCKRASVMLGES